jgi:hypothetical protein
MKTIDAKKDQTLYVRVAEVAARIGVSPQLLYKEMAAGRIPSETIGVRGRFIPRWWLEAMEKKAVKPVTGVSA